MQISGECDTEGELLRSLVKTEGLDRDGAQMNERAARVNRVKQYYVIPGSNPRVFKCVVCGTTQLYVDGDILHHMIVSHQHVGYLSNGNGNFVWSNAHKRACCVNVNHIYSRPQLLLLGWEKCLDHIIRTNTDDTSYKLTQSHNYSEISDDALEKVLNVISKQQYRCGLKSVTGCEYVFDCLPTVEILLSHLEKQH